MTSSDFIKYSLQIATMLACALLFGQIMRRLKQPAVLGEMIGGILLGPTLLGAIAPAFYAWLFTSSPGGMAARDATIKMGMLFFLFLTGLEVDLFDLQRSRRRAVSIAW